MFISINEELGRHRGQSDKAECTLCGAECESVVHVLWKCPDYNDSRNIFMIKLRDLLGESFKSMGIVERSFVLCCELCEENFELLHNCSGGIRVLDQFMGS